MKVLLIGFSDCGYCVAARDMLALLGCDVTTFWSKKKRKSKIPDDILSWKGEYIFHLKSYNILPKSLLNSAKNGAINFHPSPPRYPGSGGINRGLYNADQASGVTVHYMNEKVDNGKIILFEKVAITESDNVKSLLAKVHKTQFKAFLKIAVKALIDKEYIKDMSNLYEDESWGPHVGKIKEIDLLEEIDINITKKELDRVIRATSFGPFGPKIKIHGHTFKFAGENNK